MFRGLGQSDPLRPGIPVGRLDWIVVGGPARPYRGQESNRGDNFTRVGACGAKAEFLQARVWGILRLLARDGTGADGADRLQSGVSQAMVATRRPGLRLRDCRCPAHSGSLEALGCKRCRFFIVEVASAAVVGAPPPSVGSLSGLAVSLSTEQIVFYAQESSVIEAAAKAVGFTQPVNELNVLAAGPAPKAGGIAGQVSASRRSGQPQPSRQPSQTHMQKQSGTTSMDWPRRSNNPSSTQLQQSINDLKLTIAADGSKAPASLTNQLATAQAEEQAIAATVVATGYQVIRPAIASQATRVGGGKVGGGATSSKKVRLLAGFVIGLIIGAGIILISGARRQAAARFPPSCKQLWIPGCGGNPNPVKSERRVRCISYWLAECIRFASR